MFQHVRVIIRQLFRAYWATCESNAMVDKTLRYTLLFVCYMEAWYAPICLVALPYDVKYKREPYHSLHKRSDSK
jgi:hypothetical protein